MRPKSAPKILCNQWAQYGCSVCSTWAKFRRMIESQGGLERTLKFLQLQPSTMSRDTSQIVQSFIQPGLEQFQGWAAHELSVQEFLPTGVHLQGMAVAEENTRTCCCQPHQAGFVKPPQHGTRPKMACLWTAVVISVRTVFLTLLTVLYTIYDNISPSIAFCRTCTTYSADCWFPYLTSILWAAF